MNLPDSPNRTADGWKAFPRVLALVATLLAAGAAVRFAVNAGALWRDEAGTAAFAAMSSWAEIGKHLQYDNFPPLLLAVLRRWNALGFDGSDTGYRIFGLGVAGGILAALWNTSRWLGLRFPLWMLILVALNPLTVGVAGSLRPHGLGLLWLLLLPGLLWRAATSGRWHGLVPAQVVAVLAVQTLYTNALFLAAICGACLWIAWRRRSAAMATRVVGIGLLAALSLLPHLPNLQRSQSWLMVMKAPVSPGTIGAHLLEALAASGIWSVALWIGLVGFVVWQEMHRWQNRKLPGVDARHREVTLFTIGTFGLATTMFLVFLQVFQVYPRTWYFVSIMALGGLAVDARLHVPLVSRTQARILTGGAALAMVAALPAVWQASGMRQTNMDQIATRLSAEARPGDLILVHPHYCGISFQRYYRGEAVWTTLPPLTDHRIHRYDLVKAQLQRPDPIQPVLDQVRMALQLGQRVWVVGHMPTPDKPPLEPRPAPDNPWGWFDEPYSELWGAKVGHFLTTHAARQTIVISPLPQSVNPFENLPLVEWAGWQPRLPVFPFAP